MLQVVWRPYADGGHAAKEPVARGSHLFLRECLLFSLFLCRFSQVGRVLRQFGLRQLILELGLAACSLGSSRGGQLDTPQLFATQLENWRSDGTAPPSDGSAETEAEWRTWFDTTFAQLIVFHHSLFYGGSNVPMGIGFRASSSVSSLQQELPAAHGHIQELVSNFELFFYLLLLYLHVFLCLHRWLPLRV